MKKLYVHMNAKLVGELAKDSATNLKFTYAKSWLSDAIKRPVSLSLPLRESAHTGSAVYNFFDNLLPDNQEIRNRIQARFGLNSNESFDILSEIGRDCVGALQITNEMVSDSNKKSEYDVLSNGEVASILKGYRSAPLGMSGNSDFRISIAGAQEKTALLKVDEHWALPKGTTPTSHILKLPIGRLAYSNIDLSGSVENEFFCLKLLKAFDLPVAEAEMVQFEDVKVLSVKRFDRRWKGGVGIRLPQEDMCQALGIHSALKYQADGGPNIKRIMDVLSGSLNAQSDRRQFMKTVFLFWVLGAIDGHGKNFSLFIKSEGRYALTPIYDVMSAYPIAANKQIEWHDMKMAMGLKGKNMHYHWHNIQLRHWLEYADRIQFGRESMQLIIDEVFADFKSNFDTVAQALPESFSAELPEQVFLGFNKLKNK